MATYTVAKIGTATGTTNTVVDTFANIFASNARTGAQTGLDTLLANNSKYTSISITGTGGTVTETSANLIKYWAQFAKMSPATGVTLGLTVTGSLTAANVATISGSTTGILKYLTAGLAVSDSFTQITTAANVTALNALLSATTTGSKSELASIAVNNTVAITGANLTTLSTETFANVINLSAASITGNLTVAQAVYAHAHTGVYTNISDSVTNILSTTTGWQTAVGAATTAVTVTGTVSAANIDSLSTSTYASKVNLASATIVLSATATATEATYILAQAGTFVVNDSFSSISTANATLLADAKTIQLTGAILPTNLDTLAKASYATKVDLSTVGTISSALTVAEAVYANAQKGVYTTITDFASSLEGTGTGVQTAINAATTTVNVITSTNPLTGTDINLLFATAFANKINFSGAAISLTTAFTTATTTTVATVVSWLYTHNGLYSITDNYTNITAANATLIADASKVTLTGTVTGAQITSLMSAAYATHIDLSIASLSTLNVSQATWAYTHSGLYNTISDSALNIETASNQAALAAARTAILVSGTVTSADIDTLSASTTSYSSKINLGTATISGNLNVAEAIYAHAHGGSYATISDTYASITNSATNVTPAVAAATTTIYISGVTAPNLDTLASTSYASKINLNGATFSSVTAAEAVFANGHNASYTTVTGTATQIEGTAASVIGAATIVSISGPVTKADIDLLMGNSAYNSKVNLNSTSVTGNLSVLEASYVHTQNGTYTTISDLASTLENNTAIVNLATTIFVTGPVTGNDLTILQTDFGSKINLSTATIAANITVAEATYALAQQGIISSISDVVGQIETVPANVATAATSLFVTGTIIATDLDKLAATNYASKINLNGATFSSVTVDEAVFANGHNASYTTITGSVAQIAGAASNVISAATYLSVTGTVLASDLDSLSNASYASKINLNGATFSSVTAAEAVFANGHNASYNTVTGTATQIEGAAASVIGAATVVSISGAVTKADIDLLMNYSYSSKVNLNNISVTGNLSVLEASYVQTQNGTYTTISDLASALESNTAIASAATTIFVTGPVTGNDLTILQTDFGSKINLSTATIAANITVAEASYALAQQGTISSISDVVGQIETVPANVATAATSLFVTGTIIATDLDKLAATNYASKINLSGAAFSSVTVDEAVFANGHNASYTTVTGTATQIEGTAASVIGAATFVSISGPVTKADIDLLMNYSYSSKVNLNNISVTDSLSINEATYVQTQNGTYTTISDTASNLLAHSTDSILLGATNKSLSESVTGLSVSNAKTLFDTLQVQTNGNTYSIVGSSSEFLANVHDAAVLGASSLTLNASATGLSVMDAKTLFDNGSGDLNLHTGTYTFSIVDTAGNLLAASTDAAVLGASSRSLNASVNGLSVDDAQILFGTLAVQTKGYSYGITDNGSQLLNEITTLAGANIVSNAGEVVVNDHITYSVNSINSLLGSNNKVSFATGAGYNLLDTGSNLLTELSTSTGVGIVSNASVVGVNDLETYTVANVNSLLGSNQQFIFYSGYTLVDTLSNLDQAPASVITTASKYFLKDVSGTDFGLLSLNNAEVLAGAVNHANYLFSLNDNLANLSAATANAAVNQALLTDGYTVTDSIGNILTDQSGLLANAYNVVVTGNISDAQLNTLAQASYAGQLDLSQVTFNNTSLSVNDAAFAYEHNAVAPYTISGSALDLLQGSDQASIQAATHVSVTGDASLQHLDILLAPQNGFPTVDLTNLGTVSGSLVTGAADASNLGHYLSAVQIGTGLSISDTAANILSNPSGDSLASVIDVTGSLTKSALESLAASSAYAAKLDFSGATLVVGTTLNAPDAGELLTHGYTQSLAVKDTISNLLGLASPQFESDLAHGSTATLTDAGVGTSSTLTSTGSNLELVLKNFTSSLTINNASNITDIDISKIDGPNHTYTENQNASHTDEIITVNNHTIDLVGVNHLPHIIV